MIIKSIQLTNFQCYAGSDNFFEFTEGLNIIIGDNGHGKSKLYDAFQWVLFDECFETETRKTRKTSELKGKIVSDKAKAEAEIGSPIKCEVILTFYRKTSQRQEEEYIVRRSYIINKEDKDKFNESSNSRVNISKREPPLSARPIPEVEVQNKLFSLLPRNIRRYTWFQGEQVDNLIDFENSEAVTEAINTLSSISIYDEIVEYAKNCAENADRGYTKAARAFNKEEKQFDNLLAKQKDLIGKQNNLSKELIELERNINFTSEKFDLLIGQIENATQIRNLKVAQDILHAKIKKEESNWESEQRQITKSLFTKRWVLRNLAGVFEEYENKFSKYEDERITRKVKREIHANIEKNISKVIDERLPKGNPEPVYLKRMLKEERCLVCDREAKENTEAWLKIKELLDKAMPQKSKKGNFDTTQDFHPSFKGIYQNNLKLQDFIPHIDNSIKSDIEKIDNNKERIAALKQELKEVNNTIENITSMVNIKTEESQNIVADYDKFKTDQQKYLEQKGQKKAEEKRIIAELAECKTAIEKYTNKIPKYLLEKKTILEDFAQIAKATRDRAFEELIQKLEKEANEHFKAMTIGNESTKGYIRLIKGTDDKYKPVNTDAEGNILSNINDSNIILVKIAIILAIISAKSNSRATELYTLITDAPSSKFTDNYTIGFCDRVAQVYTQSIIMSKDFYVNMELKERLFKEVKNLGNIYVITPLREGSDLDDRKTLSTKIQKIK